ncbi:MAG: biotin transporter BioY [Cyanobacteria bacterium K_Offshore_surface_m2_239]|nr:biotin transporter BioY [Cyanobacteria bacterium K_Offshore_surface_m2_239]
MRALATWSGAIAGLLLILAGGLVSAAIPFPDPSGWTLRPLGVTLQVPALLLIALIGGHRTALLAAVAYLFMGLFQLPVFHEGGGVSYLLDPGFGYLAGFVPAAWLTGKLARQPGMDDPLALTGAAVMGLFVLHLCGLANLTLGGLAGRWGDNTLALIVGYSLAFLPQLLLCCAAGLLAWGLRRLLLVTT